MSQNLMWKIEKLEKENKRLIEMNIEWLKRNKTITAKAELYEKELDEIYYSFDEYKSGSLLPQGLINTLNNEQRKHKQTLQEVG